MTEEYMTEKQIVRYGDTRYETLDWLGHQANNIYNAANYYVRRSLFKDGEMKYYRDINYYFKDTQSKNQTNLYKIVNIHFAQQVFKMLDKNWKSWRESRKEYLKNPSKFTGKPKLPRYSDKGSFKTFVVDNQSFKFDRNKQEIQFYQLKKDGSFKKNTPRWKKALGTIKLGHKTDKIQQIIVTKNNLSFVIHIVYKINNEKFKELKEDNQRYLSIDPGLNNLMTVSSNVKNFKPIIYNGRPLKSINQYSNKRRAQLISQISRGRTSTENKSHLKSKRISKLLDKRTRKIEDYCHKASNSLINYAINYDISKIIIGNGTLSSKQNSKMSKKTNQNFISIPFSRLFQMIIYKAKMNGIEVILTEESYTSQTSFLNNEKPIKENGNNSRKKLGLKNWKRRISRGLYKSDSGKLINADLNGSYQILKKVVPEAYSYSKNNKSKGIEGMMLYPIRRISC